MARRPRISTQTVTDLRDGWTIRVTPPGVCACPAELCGGDKTFAGTVPGTLAAAVRDAGDPLLERASPGDFEVWYRCSFDGELSSSQEPTATRLVFEGLATLADVWLNGEHILSSENMFLRHEVDVADALRPRNDLCIRFASLNQRLGLRRPRPRWRSHLIDHQQLRWVRTTLTGRMPGWHQEYQGIHAVGPWRPILLVTDRAIRLESVSIRAALEQGTGTIHADLHVTPLGGQVIDAKLLSGTHTGDLTVHPEEDGSVSITGALRVPDPALWWPHTHGEQPLYGVEAHLLVDGQTVTVDLGRTGFRSLSVDTDNGNFAVAINGEPIFLRGACWTVSDTLKLAGDTADYERLLLLARDAGMNMLRLPGNGFYEADAFYDLCMELGIAVWQDFAFALMDYPGSDPEFNASVALEAEQLLHRLQANPALTVLCGNSECEAAAAMHGLSAEQWHNPLFSDLLPALAQEHCPDVPYVQSSQWGGAMPFHVNAGVSHYYGVGAYLRLPDDARRSDVRFATECLGFGNIPEDVTIDAFLAEGESPGHHPSWSAGVPRNVGQGWDFGDVCAHYTRLILGEDPSAAMYSDPERYLALGRVAHGELMASSFAEWRRPGSSCRGALVWFLRDLWPCAGWGVIDSFDRPKSVYYYLKRALSPLAAFFSDEGLSGLRLHVVNEHPCPIEGELRIAVFRHGQTCVHDSSVAVEIDARGAATWSVDDLIGHFLDTSYAYRFGPPSNDVIFASLTPGTASGLASARAFHFPTGMRFPRTSDIGLRAEIEPRSPEDQRVILTVRAERFAQAVSIHAPGYLPDDNYFHLEPGGVRSVALTATTPPAGKPLRGMADALNALGAVRIAAAPNRAFSEPLAS